MGAAASVRMVYKDALNWLRIYMDSVTYLEDFNAIDMDHDGGITFGEMQKWVMDKAKMQGGSWLCFKDHPQIMQIAHKAAGMGIDSKSSAHAGKVVDVAEFRLLLMHLFAISILLAHFEHADDLGSKQLGFDEFKTAVFTFCHTHAHETISDDQIIEDFELLDTNKSDTIGFLEVCAYCCKFIDPSFLGGVDGDATEVTGKGSKLLGIDGPTIMSVNASSDLGTKGPKMYYSSTSTEKTESAFGAIASTMEYELEAADRAMAACQEQAEKVGVGNDTGMSWMEDLAGQEERNLPPHLDVSLCNTTAEMNLTTTDGGVADTITTDTIESAVTDT